MNDTQITVQGFVGGVVSLRKAGETEVATFRLGCTPRYYNRRTDEWVDAPTQWYTVNAWRGMARNVAGSLVKGDGVTTPIKIAGNGISNPSLVPNNLEFRYAGTGNIADAVALRSC